MVKALIDSNIIMDLLNGVTAARTECSYYSDIAISAVTWMEVAVGSTATEMVQFETFIRALGVKVVHTNDVIAYRAAQIRQNGLKAFPKRNIKLPDAIIGATANVEGRIVVTRNPRDFGANTVRVPYQYDATTGIVNNVLPPL